MSFLGTLASALAPKAIEEVIGLGKKVISSLGSNLGSKVESRQYKSWM